MLSRTVLLTSFRDAPKHDCVKYSIARWQPKGCNYPSLKRLAPHYANGLAIKNLPPDEYRLAYETSVLSQDSAISELAALVGSVMDGETIALLCWCNPSRQPPPKKLMCHRILVGYWIEDHVPFMNVVYLDGAENPVWEKEVLN